MLKKAVLIFAIFGTLLASCARSQTQTVPNSTKVVSLPAITREGTSTSAPTPPASTETPAPVTVWIDEAVPAVLADAARQAEPSVIVVAREDSSSQLTVILGEELLSRWVYALVTPFPMVMDAVTLADLKDTWAGNPSGPFAGQPLLMAPSTKAAFRILWGDPADGAVQILDDDQLLQAAWDARPSWAIVPFESLDPRWKVLQVDGQSPIEKDFSLESYALTIPFGFSGAVPGFDTTVIPATNRDPGKLTVLAMTGVTALVRATAYKMDQNGVTYPARDIGGWLREADITHISNEVSFYDDCPDARPEPGPLYFCSKSSYIGLFEDVGADVIELTGNHNNDSAQVYGVDVVPANLQMYRDRGMKYYAGGENLTKARQPALIEHNGNRFAFIGCNPSGPDYAWAYENAPGAAPCGDYHWMQEEIRKLRADGYLPVATFQYFENYSNTASEQMRQDFRPMAEAGAVIVQGSQAHTPKEMEFAGGSFIHYGLGNLFFDQMWVDQSYLSIGKEEIPATRLEFIDRHIFYDGRYISTELLTAMLEDYAKPRPMTREERAAFLENIFEASGW